MTTKAVRQARQKLQESDGETARADSGDGGGSDSGHGPEESPAGECNGGGNRTSLLAS